jgi:hypothetical protein
VKRVGILGVGVRKMTALTMDMEAVILLGKGRQNLACLVKCMKLIVKCFFLADILFLVGRLRSRSSCSQINMVLQTLVLIL